MNIFWDFSVTPAPPAAAPEATDQPVEVEAKEAAEAKEADLADPSRDEILDSSRGEEEGDESRDEGRGCFEYYERAQDFSMFSTLTELLFSPFSDGYCKTPFCSDDYLPPSCPSGGFYTTPDEVRVKPQQDSNVSDDYGDICKSDSAASSMGGHPTRRRRPLAFAVGHGDEWKDAEGRRVVITPRRAPHPHPNAPPRFSSPHRQQNQFSKASTCTCVNPASTNSLTDNPNDSPHQTKSVVCKFCLDAPSNRNSESVNSQPLPPIL